MLLIAVNAGNPGYVRGEHRRQAEAVNTKPEVGYDATEGTEDAGYVEKARDLEEAGAVLPDVTSVVDSKHYSKRSLAKTFAFFTERLNIMPQSFQGLGAQFYIFTK